VFNRHFTRAHITSSRSQQRSPYIFRPSHLLLVVDAYERSQRIFISRSNPRGSIKRDRLNICRGSEIRPQAVYRLLFSDCHHRPFLTRDQFFITFKFTLTQRSLLIMKKKILESRKTNFPTNILYYNSVNLNLIKTNVIALRTAAMVTCRLTREKKLFFFVLG